MYQKMADFYKSSTWQKFRERVILERLTDQGIFCEKCSKPILKKYDLHLHHINELTLGNVNNPEISLNPLNIMVTHARCHNEIHGRYSSTTKEVFIVHGPPYSGMAEYVMGISRPNDLVVDINRIWECLSFHGRQSERLMSNVFGVYDFLLEQIRLRTGKWLTAWVICSIPYRGQRERLLESLDAKEIHYEPDHKGSYDHLTLTKEEREIIQKYYDNFT